MIALCVFFILCCNLVQGQFPRACVTDQALKSKTCCPPWRDGSPCGSTSGRGKCRDWVVNVELSFIRERQYDDDRLNWPRFYFDKTCECFGNYSGHNCGDCMPGYFGDKCDRKKTVIRKEIRELSFLERKRFFSYLLLAKSTKSKDFVILTTGDRHHKDTYKFVDVTIYNLFSWIHYISIKPILRNGTFDSTTNYAHGGPAFPGWHRLGLFFLERQIQLMTGDEDFALPYYDWRGEENCSICTDDYLGESHGQGFLSKYSHFATWKSICSGYNYDDSYCPGADDENNMQILYRKPGVHPTVRRFPSFKDVEDTLKLTNFDSPPYDRLARRSFRNALEGFLRPDGETLGRSMHNLVHIYFGGTMSEVPISSNDPMFILHHCYIDKIVEVWLTRHNATRDVYPVNNQPGQGPRECSTPYFPCYLNKDLLHRSTKFGYTYSKYQQM